MLQLANLRSTSGQPLKWAEVNLAEILRWSIGQVRQNAEERNITIEQNVEPTSISGVEDHLKMLFVNLLSNAVTYSREGGQVVARCLAIAADGPLVTVEDNGIGIAAEKLPRIFEEYYRTDEAAQHNRESTGLGLAIVKQVAHTYRIRICVESVPDVGTKFTLRFPRTRKNALATETVGRR